MLTTKECRLPKKQEEAFCHAYRKLKSLSLADQIVSVKLYGSCARNEAHPSSDVDLLVIVKDKKSLDANREELLLLKSDGMISDDVIAGIDYHFITKDHWDAPGNSLYFNIIKKEGIEVWT